MATYKGHNEDSSGNILLSIGNGMTATVETGPTASQAYTKGAYIFFNNRFCKATKAISSGATLTIGNNLSETSVGAELTSHLRSSDGKEFYFDVKDGTYGYYPSASKTASEFVPFGGTAVLEDKQAVCVNTANSKDGLQDLTNITSSSNSIQYGGNNGALFANVSSFSALNLSFRGSAVPSDQAMIGLNKNTKNWENVTVSSAINISNYDYILLKTYGVSVWFT